MLTEQDVVRLLLAYQDVWFLHFPQLSRRADWHIPHHLCTKGRGGAPVGELYGLVKQVFLLDDSTVKERILSLAQMGFCTLDPPGQVFSRTVAMPTPVLLAAFDGHLRAFQTKLAEAAGVSRADGAAAATPAWRTQVLRLLDIYQDRWSGAVDAVFAAGKLSPARRNDAKRHLIASSHWNLVHNVVLWHVASGSDATGVLADRLAAHMLQLTGQTLQTTRDHIGYLIEIGVFQRLKGRAMQVCLTDPALRHIGDAVRETAAELPGLLLQMFGDMLDDPAERTLNRKPSRQAPRPFLEVSGTGERRDVGGPLTIGRAAPSDLILHSSDISRRHCRVEPREGRLLLTDLGSTNGTFVNDRQIDAPTLLSVGDQVRLGSFVLVYGDATADATQRGQSAPAHLPTR